MMALRGSCWLAGSLSVAWLIAEASPARGQSSFRSVSYGVQVIEAKTGTALQQAALQTPQPANDQSPAPAEQIEGPPLTRNPLEPLGAQSGDALTPLLNRPLSVEAQAVSTSNARVGTGLVPMPKEPISKQAQLLPDGYARGMVYTPVYWRASNIQHHPLYFEDAMLERHGPTHCCLGHECCQSAVSGAKFFGTIFLLPYLRTLQPKHECVYALGHYRAGSAAPCLRDNLPYDRRAAIVESASAAAFFWAMPL